jgi:hypothetical protein
MAQAVNLPDGDYIIYINTTPVVTTASGYTSYKFGKQGAWNSSFTFNGVLPQASSQAMTDTAVAVTSADGNPHGSGVIDTYAGAIGISVSSNIVAITSFAKDTIFGTAGGDFAQYYNLAIPANACGLVDDANSKLDLVLSSRLGAISGFPTLYDERWNVGDAYANGATTCIQTPADQINSWVPFTTASISNSVNVITGAPLASLGDVNGDALTDFSAILVTGSCVGSDWGSFNGTPFFEAWNVQILSVDNSPATVLGSCTVGSVTVTADVSDLSGTLASFESGVSGCSLSGSPVNASEGGAWALLLGFLAWLKALTWRRKRDSSRI